MKRTPAHGSAGRAGGGRAGSSALRVAADVARRTAHGAIDWAFGVGWWVRTQFVRGTPDAFTAPGPDAAHAMPLVLLPGIWERWTFLDPLARALNGYGHPVYLIAALGNNGMPLDASSALVARFLIERDLPEVILVAHSKGGLIGKLVMLDPQVAGRVRGMVALSTPFAGSSLAWPIFKRSPLGIFAPRGRAIVDLAAQREVNARIISLQPTHDQVIPEGSRLEGARNVTLEVAGHFRPLRNPAVHRTIHDLVHELEAQPR